MAFLFTLKAVQHIRAPKYRRCRWDEIAKNMCVDFAGTAKAAAKPSRRLIEAGRRICQLTTGS
jgi:hypothetical protein